jgi:alkanesulfonate monooxygenase SsuD/methylene tetrahydromethanopterin reductase-like flavin-dependent oxidoreductase (luciferase family)
MHIAGTPAEVADTILAQQKEIGFGTFIGEFRFGSLPHDKAQRSMELFARKVMPLLGEGTRESRVQAS